VEAIEKMMEALAIAQAHSMPSIWARLRHTNSASALPLTARLSWERKAEATEFVHNFAYVLGNTPHHTERVRTTRATRRRLM
jgi:hypothetical protein